MILNATEHTDGLKGRFTNHYVSLHYFMIAECKKQRKDTLHDKYFPNAVVANLHTVLVLVRAGIAQWYSAGLRGG
jgi:hypothetical protein